MIAEERAEQLRRSRRTGLLARGRGNRRARARRLPRPRPKLLALLAIVLGLLVGAWLWVRDSSLVAVHRVTVSGVSGPDSSHIRRALVAAARTMTTLDVRIGELSTAVAPYEVVKALHVSTQFPHGMRIRVIEQNPVGQVTVGSRAIPVAADGTLLRDVPASSSLPSIPLRVLPGGVRLTDPQAREEVSLLTAAPDQILARLNQVTSESGHGLVAQVRGGPSIYFGDATRLSAKWAAAIAVLADPGSDGADYIDVTDPRRPAAGVSGAAALVGSGGSASGAASSEGTASTGSATSTGSVTSMGSEASMGSATSTGVAGASPSETGSSAGSSQAQVPPTTTASP